MAYVNGILKMVLKTVLLVISPVVINNSWSVRNRTTSHITNKGLNRLSNEFNRANKNQIHKANLLDEKQLSGNSKKSRQQQSFFIILSLITNSGHGVFTNHNRRFYYNSFSDQLEPIYYDGNSRYQSLNHLNPRKWRKKTSSTFSSSLSDRLLLKYRNFLDLDYAESKLRDIDITKLQIMIRQRGVDLDLIALTNLKNELLDNLRILRNKLYTEANSVIQKLLQKLL